MNFLEKRLGPFPIWVWGAVVIAGVGVFFLVRHFQSGGSASSGATLGQNPAGQVNPLNPTNDPNLDPNTGIPYQIEEAIDPNTGLPYYLELTNGASSPGQAGGGSQGATAAVPPIPNTMPPGAAPPVHVGSGPLTTTGHIAIRGGPMPAVHGGGPGTIGPGNVHPVPPVRGGREIYQGAPPGGGHAINQGAPPGGGHEIYQGGPPGPPPGGHEIYQGTPPGGSPAVGSGDWEYPFWAGQGGTLYSGV